MHIVFFDYVTQFGGAPRVAAKLAAGLAESARVSVIDPYGFCPEFRDAVERSVADYHILDPAARRVVVGGRNPLDRSLRVLRSLRGLRRIQSQLVRKLREIDATVVCASSYKALSTLGTSLRLRGLPLVGFTQGWCLPELIPAYARWLYRKRCAALFTVSEPSKAALRCLGVAPGKITVLHNTIDVDTWLTHADQPFACQLPQLDRPVRLLLPALLVRTKGQHTAIRALKEIVGQGVDAVLWLAGDLGVAADRSYVDSTRQLALELRVADRVEWLGLRPDMPQLMKVATMVVLPTHSEGFGLVVAEAMALGTPVIATPVGGILDLILPGVTGYFFDVEDPAGLADCVLEVTQHPDRAAVIARQAQDYIRTSPRFRAENQVEKALAVFRKVSVEGRQ